MNDINETPPNPASAGPHAVNTPPSQLLGTDYSFEFKGKGGEYFSIWIVNVLLSIVTLGIYSAWATVRTRRYFYANFKLAGEGFEYHAEPLQILKGRIIAIVAFLVYSASSALSPAVGVITSLIVTAFIPLFILMSLRFSRRMTSYKNIRFSFRGGVKEAYMAILFWPLVGILTLGILFPLAQVKLKRFVVDNTRYGTENFDFAGTYSDYGKLLLLFLLFYFLAVLGITLGAMLDVVFEGLDVGILVTTTASMIVLYGGIFFIQAKYMNLMYRRTTLREHGFESTYTGLGYLWIWVSNITLIILTLGIFLPFAKVRLTNYLAEHLTLRMNSSLDDFTAGEGEKVSALGQEMGSAFDFDLGIGI